MLKLLAFISFKLNLYIQKCVWTRYIHSVLNPTYQETVYLPDETAPLITEKHNICVRAITLMVCFTSRACCLYP